MLGYAVLEKGQNCDENTPFRVLSNVMHIEQRFADEAENGKQLCLAAVDRYGNPSWSAQAVQGIWTRSIILSQLPAIISRKHTPIVLDDAQARYASGSSEVFSGTLTHNAQDLGLDAQNPSAGNYVLTYIAEDGGKSQSVTGLRVVEITDADPLKKQIEI